MIGEPDVARLDSGREQWSRERAAQLTHSRWSSQDVASWEERNTGRLVLVCRYHHPSKNIPSRVGNLRVNVVRDSLISGGMDDVVHNVSANVLLWRNRDDIVGAEECTRVNGSDAAA